MPRAMLGKAAAVVVVAGVIAVGLVKGGGSSAEPTVQAFLLAWQNGQYKTAAAMTTGRQQAVVGALAGAYRQLDAADLVMQMSAITQHGASAQAVFRASVELGSGGLPWSYQGRFAMHRTGSTWKVVWNPSVVVPGLRSGDRLAVLTRMPDRAQVEDSAGKPLAVPSLVYVAGVHPSRLADPEKTAAALAAVTGLDAGQVYGQIIAAPSKEFLGLIRLQPAAYARVHAKLGKVPGLVVVQRQERLFNSIAPAITGSVGTETAGVLRQEGAPYQPGATVGLSGLQAAYQRTLAGAATTEVVLENAAGHQLQVLKRWPGLDGTPVRTTIDSSVQQAADRALAGLPGSAAIVAIRPGTGRILAAASRQAGGLPAVSPLAGRYSPGQAFTIVSTAALLQTGLSPASPVPCRAVNSAPGRRFTNQPAEVGLGAQPSFATDFAHACVTAFAGLSLHLNAANLASAAKAFGIGAGYRLNVDSYPGSIGTPAGYSEIASASVGAGSVRVSPLGMALAAGMVQSGTWYPPTLVTSPADPGLAPRHDLSAQVISSLRSLMRTTVTKGAGTAADVAGGHVYGQVGNTGHGSAGRGLRSAWFVGYQGNVAFAVIEVTKSASVSAAPVAGSFLRHLHG